jgi:hypothetical protein
MSYPHPEMGRLLYAGVKWKVLRQTASVKRKPLRPAVRMKMWQKTRTPKEILF